MGWGWGLTECKIKCLEIEGKERYLRHADKTSILNEITFCIRAGEMKIMVGKAI